MLFNSFQFFVFFAVVTAVHFSLPQRWRWVLLLAASYYFYMCWKPEYVVLILFATGVNYALAIAIERQDRPAARRLLLSLSLTATLGVLLAFKYFNFVNESVRGWLAAFNIVHVVPYFNILLPVGISFYTFQTLSYTIDVYWKKRPAERHLGIFALYVSFFPQLVAGPIERSTRLLPQFRRPHAFDARGVADGLTRMLWGLFKKTVIADRAAVVVDAVYGDPSGHAGLPLIVGTLAFAYQIYCDFSGYSDIAVGAARVLGYDLMQNFDRPYRARSIGDFWRRWHISLSTWFRDYLYIPLGGNRVPGGRWALNILVVFLLSGLWHGAAWTFLLWGGLHGVLLMTGACTGPVRARVASWLGLGRVPRIRNGLAVAATFALVCLGWVLFRADSIRDAAYIYTHLFTGAASGLAGWWGSARLHVGAADWLILLGSVCLLETVEWLEKKQPLRAYLAAAPVAFRWAAYQGLVWLIFFCGQFGRQAFIYFQF